MNNVSIDNSSPNDNWITNKTNIEVTVACEEMFGSFKIDLRPGESKRVTYDIKANAYPLGKYSYDDLKYQLGKSQKWEVRLDQGVLVMVNPAAPSNIEPKPEQQNENTNKVKCAKCNKYFDWNEAYNQQDTPGSSAYNPPGSGEFRPRAFCPECGFLVAEWDIDQKGDRNQWKWYDQNEKNNAGKELPPSPITLWGKSIPIEVRVSVLEDQIDLSKMTEGVSNEKFFNAAASGDVETVKKQISAGIDINTKNFKGETSVMIAAMNGYTEVVNLLIDDGVDLNDQNVYGKHTPLILAALGGHLETVKVLLDAGADTDLSNQFGKTAEEAAKDSGHSDVVALLTNANKTECEEETLVGFCDLCGNPISQPINVPGVLFHGFVDKKGFNPYKTPGIDMSRSIQMSRALGTAAKFNDEEELKEALFQNWKKLALQNFTDWGLCSECAAAYHKAIKKADACFIATAAFQSPFSKEVNLLRIYRDTILTKYFAGRCFIAFYYSISPYIAFLIKKDKGLQYITRKFLSPFIEFCKRKDNIKSEKETIS